MRSFIYMSKVLSLNQEIQQFANLELLAKTVVKGFITGLHYWF